jgi:hypothetical protein
VEFSVEFFVELLANKEVRNREGMGEKTIVPLMLLGKKQNREGVGEKTTIPLILYRSSTEELMQFFLKKSKQNLKFVVVLK